MAAVFRGAFGYCFLVFMLRIVGRRPGKPSTSLTRWFARTADSETNSLCAVIAVGMMHRLMFALAVRYPKIAEIVYGIPLVLLENGQ
jgi:uncharacterized membrane protein YcaP (DUF421 family)